MLVCSTLAANAQSESKVKAQWTLQEAISYALDHNISIQQNVLNARLAKLTLRQSQYAQLPSLNLSPTYGWSWGRSIDPTTNQFVQGKYSFVSAGASSNVLVFGWFAQRNTIAKNKLSLQAAQADLDQLRNDVSLNVATGFLRILMAREQIRVNEKQVALSTQQMQQTQKFAEVGRVPELNVAQLEAQLASDSAALISAIADYTASVLDLKAILNLDFETPFEATIPDLPMEERISLQNMNAEYIYETAVKNIPSVRSSQLKLKAAQKNRDALRGGLYPSLSLSGQLGSNWTSTYRQLSGYNTDGSASPTGAYVNVGGTNLDVLQPNVVPTFKSVPLFTQLDNNFRQTVSATLSIPIFNGWQSQFALQQAKLNVQSQELNQYQTELKLRQDVYKAHNDAANAVQKYYASLRSKEAAQRAFDFAEKRYQLGLTNTVEYLVTQNNLYKAEASLLNSKYDLIFKLKVIDYYLGKQLVL
jgi:outer membrane protein